jgi:hypothetical protein
LRPCVAQVCRLSRILFPTCKIVMAATYLLFGKPLQR